MAPFVFFRAPSLRRDTLTGRQAGGRRETPLDFRLWTLGRLR